MDTLRIRLDQFSKFVKFAALPSSLSHRLQEHLHLQLRRPLTDAFRTQLPAQLYKECAVQFVELTRRCPLFSSASLGFQNFLASKINELHLLPGDLVYHAGDLADSMYFVHDGCVRTVSKWGEFLTDNSTCFVRGHYFGELGILFDALRTETTMSDKSETSKVPLPLRPVPPWLILVLESKQS